jgi:peroxiredoxin
MIFRRGGLGWVAVAVLLGIGVLAVGLARGGFGPVAPGEPAPDYHATSLEGDTIHLADYRGEVVLLNVWATWCSPCVREMPALQRLHERFADRGLNIIAVSIDATGLGLEPLAHVREFVDRFQLTFQILHDATGETERLFSVTGLPVTFVIDRNGRIIEKAYGAREWDGPEYAARIEKLLAD